VIPREPETRCGRARRPSASAKTKPYDGHLGRNSAYRRVLRAHRDHAGSVAGAVLVCAAGARVATIKHVITKAPAEKPEKGGPHARRGYGSYERAGIAPASMLAGDIDVGPRRHAEPDLESDKLPGRENRVCASKMRSRSLDTQRPRPRCMRTSRAMTQELIFPTRSLKRPNRRSPAQARPVQAAFSHYCPAVSGYVNLAESSSGETLAHSAQDASGFATRQNNAALFFPQ